jgi:hypothetical protein
MLSETCGKRHLIISPPPKKVPFGGEGVAFFEYFHEFLVLSQQKNSGKNFEQAETFDVLIGRFRPFHDFLKFKKSGIFSIFGQIWQLFFSKYDFEQNWS